MGAFRVNEKLTNRVVNLISLIGTILGLNDIIQAIKDQQWNNIVAPIIIFLAFILVLIFFHHDKRGYVDLYAICNSMSLNNRLQRCTKGTL